MARVLVVEDEAIVAQDIRQIVEGLGHSVLGPAASGSQALTLAGDSRPDLVLMDIVLKGRMTGIEAAEEIRSNLDIPIVFLTAYADEATLQKAKLTAPFGYVLKPFDERELHTAIEIAMFRHRIERSLKESEAWLTITLQSIGDAVIVTDQRGAVVLINRAAEGITGWSQSEALGEDAPTLLPIQREEGGAFEHPIQQALREGATLVLEDKFRLIAKDGTAVWIGDSVAPIKDDRGEVKGSVVVFRDVTRRRQAEVALREAEQKYRDIFENAIEGIFQSTPQGHIIMANPAAARILGYDSAEELLAAVTDIGTQVHEHVEQRRAILEQLEAGSVRGAVLQYCQRGGRPVWVSVSARAVKDTAGAVLRYEGTIVDVTEQRRAEEAETKLRAALERAAQEWEQTFDSIEAPILILDAAGRIVRLNRAAKDLSGEASYQGLLGRVVGEGGPGEPWRKAGDLARKVATRGAPQHVQLRDEASGRTWDIAAGPATRLEGQDERVIVVARDITPMVELQESLRRSETMSALGSVVAGVAHEVRNPLFGISANLDAFAARFGDRDEYAETIGALREGVGRLVEVMNELLEYGRPAQKAPTVETLAGIVARAVESCSGLTRSSGVAIVTQVPMSLATIAVDRDRIVRVFQNLIENAAQHTPQGGTVRVEAREQRIGGQRLVECMVMDSGPGFREEDLPRIFEPFFTRRQGGTGLGLSIVQRIVDLHGGSITAANRPQGGATVTVRFPASDSPSEPRVSAATPRES